MSLPGRLDSENRRAQRRRSLLTSACALTLGVVLSVCACDLERTAPSPSASAAAAVNAARVVARGIVELPGGLFEVLPPQDGSLVEVAVREGEQVRPGQLLARLDGTSQQQDMVIAAAELDVATARLQAQRQRLPAARRLADRWRQAVRATAAEPQRAEDAEQALAEQQAAVLVAEAETGLARRRLQAARTAAERLSLRATTAAQVLRVQVQTGARVTVQGGRPLMLLLPEQSLRVRAELNEAFVERVQPGRTARVYADGDLPADGSATVAHVVRVSPVFSASRLDPDAQPRALLRVVDCFLVFDAPTTLRAGQAVRVEIDG